MNDTELANEIRDHYRNNPDAVVISVAEAMDEPENRIIRILDEYRVNDDDTIDHVGPGMGGGWAPPAELSNTPIDIGARWPDGSLREEPFDLDNPDHRSEMLISDELYEKIKIP